MKIESDLKLDYSDVLIRPRRSNLESRNTSNLKRRYEFGRHHSIPGHELIARGEASHSTFAHAGVPIMVSNMDGVATFEMATAMKKHGVITCLKKSYSAEAIVEYLNKDNPEFPYAAITLGIKKADMDKLMSIYQMLGSDFRKLKFVCIDVANGYIDNFVKFVSKVREMFPSLIIFAGNVATPELTEDIIRAGADVVKIGIGPGSVCTTRSQTGIGYPQLSAVMECSEAAHRLGGLIIADGGCQTPGDIVKALAAGGDFVMLGGMLAGHDEGTDETNYTEDREKYPDVQFHGMSSTKANGIHHGGMQKGRASEGRVVSIPPRGKVENTMDNIKGCLRSAMTYIGALDIEDIPNCATFVRVNNQLNRVFEQYTVSK